jgi:hypothetical protein
LLVFGIQSIHKVSIEKKCRILAKKIIVTNWKKYFSTADDKFFLWSQNIFFNKVFSFFDFGHFFCPILKNQNTFHFRDFFDFLNGD